ATCTTRGEPFASRLTSALLGTLLLSHAKSSLCGSGLAASGAGSLAACAAGTCATSVGGWFCCGATEHALPPIIARDQNWMLRLDCLLIGSFCMFPEHMKSPCLGNFLRRCALRC